MDETKTLYFFDYLGESMGEVTLSEKGKLVSSTDRVERFVSSVFRNRRISTDTFFERYDNYNNGYIQITSTPVMQEEEL